MLSQRCKAARPSPFRTLRPGTIPAAATSPTSWEILTADPTPNRWLNTAAFVGRPLYTLDDVGRNSIFKEFRIKERTTLQFRSEFFNIFSHPNLGQPGNALGASNFGAYDKPATGIQCPRRPHRLGNHREPLSDAARSFLDPDEYPAVAPPWGTLNAVNLNTGDYAWKAPLGEYPALKAKGTRITGTENYGGPIVMAGGLVFIGATNFDKKFRAFDKSTGAILWETTLPLAGNATPITYKLDGRQFVVITQQEEKHGQRKSPEASTWPMRFQ